MLEPAMPLFSTAFQDAVTTGFSPGTEYVQVEHGELPREI